MGTQGADLLPIEEAQKYFDDQAVQYKVKEVVTISIRELGRSTDPKDLVFYHGSVKFGTSKREHVASCVLCFKTHDDVVAVEKLFNDLCFVASPYIVSPFSYGRGVGDLVGHSFLAVPQFSCTLVPYLRPSSKVTIDKQRFTDEFAGIIRDVINGILTLHGKGYCCRYLKPCHILVFTVGAVKTGKIWNFRRRGVKSKDWTRLGHIIKEAAQAQVITIEINDLCTRLINGSLQGLQVLKHSALLTVREKFENVLALNFYIEVHKKDQFQSASADQQAVADLKSFIAAVKNWRKKIPAWIAATPGYIPRHGDKGGAFVLWLRDRAEHYFTFVPTEVPRQSISITQVFGTEPDLECVLRETWPDIYLEVQNLVTRLDIHY